MRKTKIQILLAAVATAILLTASVAPANASATGSTAIATFSYSTHGITINVPTGCFLTHHLNGNGQLARYANVGTDCVGPAYWGGFCNYWFVYDFRNLAGQIYYTWNSGLYATCNYGTLHHYEWNQVPGGGWIVEVGKACVRLYVEGSYRAQQCHNILA